MMGDWVGRGSDGTVMMESNVVGTGVGVSVSGRFLVSLKHAKNVRLTQRPGSSFREQSEKRVFGKTPKREPLCPSCADTHPNVHHTGI